MSIAYSRFKGYTSNKSVNNDTASVSNIPVSDIVSNDPIIDIHVSAANLPKADIGSNSDPMCVLFILQNGRYIEVDRTEVIWDDPNPSWVHIFKSMYVFETNQPLRFCIYDVDSENGPLENHDYIGFCDTTVQHLVSNHSQDIKLPIKSEKVSGNRGTLVITSEQTSNSSSIANFVGSFQDLKRMRTFSRNCPYLVISKPSESGRNLPVFRSEVIPKCSTCTFKPFSIPLNTLCNGDIQSPIVISAYDNREGKEDIFIGSTSISFQTLLENLGNQYKLKDNKNKDVGFVRFPQLNIIQKPTFLDYLRSGIQLNLVTAIDYTASNRDPRDHKSLHFLTQSGFNQYESCIFSIGSVICPYDTDQLFPVYGYGGKVNGIVSHCFPLTFQPENPSVVGLDGILAAYRNSLQMVQLSGPTCFAPVIKSATSYSEQSYTSSHTYTILLIVTDGVINDMPETIDAIVEASSSPLSIIIVGVGNADFSLMEQLDADKNPLRHSNGQSMKRDIVQFVPFNQITSGNGNSLAAEVLAEIPKQVDDFCKSHNFIPTIQS